MNNAVRIRPLPTYPLTLPATQETRATQDILGPQGFGSMSDDPTPQLLNHPPVLMVHADGGEVLLNRDAVVSQLQSNGGTGTRVPNSLVVYTLRDASLDMSLRTLHFLYGQLQQLHYQKKDANGNNLADIAAHTLKTDRALYTAIAQDLFGRRSLELRHYKALFMATNLGDRSIRNLKNPTGKNARKKKELTTTDTSLKKISSLPMNNIVDHKNATVEGKGDAAIPPPAQEARPSDDIYPSGTRSPTRSSTYAPTAEHQFHLALTEEDA